MHLQQLASSIIHAPLLATVPALPADLQHLDLSCCSILQQLPDVLPAGLKTLDCSACYELLRLPPHLPGGLQQLKIGSCSLLADVPELPRGLTYLDFNR